METVIVWLRRDLRLADNPALYHGAASGARVIPIYVHDPQADGAWAPGAASRWWLHYSLQALAAALREAGSRLLIRRGPTLEALRALAAETGADCVYWNRCYEPAQLELGRTVRMGLERDGLRCASHNAGLLFEPWEVKNGAGGPYRVFTPYWRRCQQLGLEQAPLPAPARLSPVPRRLRSERLSALGLLPAVRWDAGLRETWTVGEAAAAERLAAFIDEALADYPTARDRPATAGTSRLSPYLHFGEIGPRQVLAALRSASMSGRRGGEAPVEALLRQLAWREFAYHILYHFPHTTNAPLDPRFAGFPWRRSPRLLRAWQRGRTGVPLVDAGMRELWHTGWMHNRVRMVVASFLTKHCRIRWQAGARWFWDTLVDADLANNSLGWQWAAGSGADAAPYFRVFNPQRQSERFDPQGQYLARWVPELADLEPRWRQQPWNAPGAGQGDLLEGGPLADYPAPVVDLARGREEALAAYRRHMQRRGGEGQPPSPA
ncbi:MAG TPA: deoxyribodipyrimidine photo-lyase [Gammaproteobacteria bacterium]|nr:deoxyribodipyrimidine photo-lyase [Gammaproteobacteria bacterium]